MLSLSGKNRYRLPDRKPGTLGDEPGPHLVVGVRLEQLGGGGEYPVELVMTPGLPRLTPACAWLCCSVALRS